MSIGIRELRNSLSKHLAEVRGGRTLTITDHGRPIARIVPVDAQTPYETLVAEGRITVAKRPRSAAGAPVTSREPLGDLLGEQRR